MHYISTRHNKKHIKGFKQTVLGGLANDGGLFIPEKIPFFNYKLIDSFRCLSYEELAYQVMLPFVGDAIAKKEFREIINQSYSRFSHQAIAPLHQCDRDIWIAELFHGPTFAFKDFALQFLGNILNYFLKEDKNKAVILGATSGDTGSAAIEGCRHGDYGEIFILHPHESISNFQRRQMTTLNDRYVHNIAVKTDFDGCQSLVKACFNDKRFLAGKMPLIAINSINWARIMAQIVYYFYIGLRLGAPNQALNFSVPSGNFGNVYAGYLARKMGLPIKKIIVATNSNNILHRFFEKNDYSCQVLQKTLAPSMDIMVSSNFERFLFDMYRSKGDRIKDIISAFKMQKKLSIDVNLWNNARQYIVSHSSNDREICEAIQKLYHQTGYIMDPHTATGMHAVTHCLPDCCIPTVVLSTAHPIKFTEALKKAQVPMPKIPHQLQDLYQKEEHYTVMAPDLKQLKSYILNALT